MISIILPVLNEPERINDMIGHILSRAGGEDAEIIVVDGDAAGSTIKKIVSGRARIIIAEKGRARQMNCGASIARGDTLLFLHADTLLPPHAFDLIDAVLRDRRVVAGAFRLGIDSRRWIFRITEKYVAVRTWLTRVPFGDQGIFVRRDYFLTIGGFQEIPLMEDVELMKRIKKRGDRISLIGEQVLTSPRRFEREGVVYCTCRNLVLQALYAFGVPPERLAKWYGA